MGDCCIDTKPAIGATRDIQRVIRAITKYTKRCPYVITVEVLDHASRRAFSPMRQSPLGRCDDWTWHSVTLTARGGPRWIPTSTPRGLSWPHASPLSHGHGHAPPASFHEEAM